VRRGRNNKIHTHKAEQSVNGGEDGVNGGERSDRAGDRSDLALWGVDYLDRRPGLKRKK
jgi:hypothetical protein